MIHAGRPFQRRTFTRGPAERRPPAFPSATVRINADPPLILMNVMPAKANVSDPIRGVRRAVDRKGGEHA